MNIRERKRVAYTSLHDCLKRMLKLGGNQQVEVAVHNLSFDGSFIVPALAYVLIAGFALAASRSRTAHPA
jgi:hypothetical protein